MISRPILFSGAMVRALRAGTKTQTRRAVKRQPWASCCIEDGMQGESPFVYSALGGDGPGHDVHEERTPCRCPYGVPGDRLWVRETWAHGTHALAAERDEDGPFVYAATDSTQHRLGDRWHPSIHMPRVASRITLEVSDVRVERLQSISDADVLAEGIAKWPLGYRVEESGAPDHRSRSFEIAKLAYRWLWESINGPGSWDENPWVWVVVFERAKA